MTCEESQQALAQLKKLGLTEMSADNCLYAKLEKDEKFPKDMTIALVKGDGTSLYLIRDMACAIARTASFKYSHDPFMHTKIIEF